MLEEISKIAAEVAKRKGATLLIDKAGPTLIGISNVIYADAGFDITEEVTKEVNKDRPACGSPLRAAAPQGRAAPSPTLRRSPFQVSHRRSNPRFRIQSKPRPDRAGLFCGR